MLGLLQRGGAGPKLRIFSHGGRDRRVHALRIQRTDPQVVCFVRAMPANPRILILDEATSSVDTVTESRLQHALTKLLLGRTSFVVAHRLSTIRHADLVLVLDGGRIVEQGNHRQLLSLGGRYARMYQQFLSSTELGVASLGA